MSDNNQSNIDNFEIEPLSDEDLEDASGGCIAASCSGSNCSNGKVQEISPNDGIAE